MGLPRRTPSPLRLRPPSASLPPSASPALRLLDLVLVLGEIRPVAAEQARHVGGDDVDPAADPLRLPGLQPPDPEVGVQAGGDALEQLLVRLPRGGEDRLL